MIRLLPILVCFCIILAFGSAAVHLDHRFGRRWPMLVGAAWALLIVGGMAACAFTLFTLLVTSP